MTKLEKEYELGRKYGEEIGWRLAARKMKEQAVAYFDMGRDEDAKLWRQWSVDFTKEADKLKERPNGE